MKKILFSIIALLMVITTANAQDASFICTCNKDISKKLLQSTDTIFRLDIGSSAKFITMGGNVVKSYEINSKQVNDGHMFFFFDDSEGHQGAVSVAMDVNSVGVIDKTIQNDAFMLKLDLDKTKEFNAKKHSSSNTFKYPLKNLHGTWEGLEIDVNGEMANLSDFGTQYQLSYTFTPNGTYKQSGFIGNFTGIYKINGDYINIYSVYGEKYIRFKVISITNDMAVITMNIDGDDKTYKFKIRKL